MRQQSRHSSSAMTRSRSVPLRQYLEEEAVKANHPWNVEQYFTGSGSGGAGGVPEIPDVLEFGSSWCEISDAKVLEGAMLTSSVRRAATGGASSSKNGGSFLPSIGGGGGGAAAAATSFAASRLALMGPSGGNAIGLGVQRRFLSVTLFTQLGQVQVLTDDAKVPLTIRIYNRRGETLQPWDFYVGAVIDILGRPTTLASASATTQEWLDSHARRLWRIKVALEERLNKFRSKPRADLDNGVFKRLAQPGTALGGVIPLNQLATCVARLEDELRNYQ